MFSLLYGFWQWYFSKTEHGVLILGLDSAGKTALLEQIKLLFLQKPPLPHDKLVPTVGLNMAKVEVGPVRLVVWDLGGQRGLRSIWDKYFDSAHALIYVVDACDRVRFNEATQTLESVLARPELAQVPVLILANKQDRPDAAQVSELEQLCLAARRDRPFVRFAGVSALTGDGVASSIHWLCEVLPRSIRPK